MTTTFIRVNKYGRTKYKTEEEDEINGVFITIMSENEHGREDIKEDKEMELKDWNRYDAYEEMEQEDKNVLDSTWVIKKKEGGRIKTTPCVKECQEDLDPSADSPTADRDSMKMILTITENKGFEMKNLAMKSIKRQHHHNTD